MKPGTLYVPRMKAIAVVNMLLGSNQLVFFRQLWPFLLWHILSFSPKINVPNPYGQSGSRKRAESMGMNKTLALLGSMRVSVEKLSISDVMEGAGKV